MGGVSGIGAIPCAVFNNMTRIAPLRTHHSLITWSAGHLQAITSRPLQDVVNAADRAGHAAVADPPGVSAAAYVQQADCVCAARDKY